MSEHHVPEVCDELVPKYVVVVGETSLVLLIDKTENRPGVK